MDVLNLLKVELLLFQPEEVLAAAEALKSIGNEQFKAQNYELAKKKYSKTLR